MKEYTYFGDLQEDLKKVNKKFDYKYFLIKMGFQLLGLITFCSLSYFTGIINNVLVFCVGYLTSASILSFISERSKAKYDSKLTVQKVANLYEEIFDNENLSVEKMKECVAIESKQKIVEDTETLNVMLSDEEKLVTNFYLLSPEEKIHILRQVKNSITGNSDNSVYLLEDEDIQLENIDIPEVVIKKLKKKKTIK